MNGSKKLYKFSFDDKFVFIEPYEISGALEKDKCVILCQQLIQLLQL